MSLLLISSSRELHPLKKEIQKVDANVEVEIWPRVKSNEKVTFAVSWKHPKNGLGNFENLKAVSSLGAGVNHLLNDTNIPQNVKLCRIVTNSLKTGMADYVLNAITNYRLNTLKYFRQKAEGKWIIHESISKKDCAVGIMGLGEMGKTTANLLLKNGYSVNGWSTTKKELIGIKSYAGLPEYETFLSASNVVVCLLPLTKETQGILDLDLFKKIKNPSFIINVGRGKHLVEEDLIYALDTGLISGACLDVFEEEPLPGNHVFWNRKNIMITPHIASVTPFEEAAPIIVENYKRAMSGMDLINQVNRDKGY